MITRRWRADSGWGQAWLAGLAVPVAVYVLAAVILTWPLARDPGGLAPGLGHADSYMMLRQAWAARESLLDGRNPLEQALLVYPEGFTSRMQWSTPLRWVPTMLLMWLVTPLAAFNLWLMATLALNGLAAYRLGLELTGGHRGAALIGGLVFAAHPTMQGHLAVGHIDVLAMYGLPLFALCLWRVLFGGAGWRAVFWGGVWLMVASLGLTSQVVYHVLPVAGFLGLAALVSGRAFRRGEVWAAQPGVRAAVLVLWGGVLLLPFFGPLMTAAGQREIDALSETGRVAFSADLLAVVSPSPFGPLADLGLVPGYARDVLATNSAEGAAYVGAIGLGLVAVALGSRLRRRVALVWLAVAVGALMLSWGPLLKWRDQPVVVRVESFDSYVTLPWAALQHLPVLESTRTPGRFNGATALAVAALAALGAERVLAAAPRLAARRYTAPRPAPARRAPGLRWGEWAAVGLLCAAILVDYQLFWPYPTWPADQGPYFERLARADGVRAVLNLPADDPLAAQQALYQQTIHGKPMIAGQLYRRTPQDPARLALLERAALGGDDAALPAMPPEMARWLLAWAGADRVIVHKRFVPGPASLDQARALLGSPDYEDDLIAAFRVPAVVPGTGDGLPPGVDLLWAALPGWTALARFAEFSAPYMGESAAWAVFAPTEQVVEMTIPAASLGLPRRVAVWLDGQIAAAQWVAETDRVTLALWLSPGVHTLRFEALDGCDPYRFPVARPEGDPVPLGDPACLSVALASPAWKVLDPPPQPDGVRLDHGVTLRGHTVGVEPEPRAVTLRLFWAAERALPGNYALFVHVADPQTGVPLAQADLLPLLATDRWQGGAVWSPEVQVALGDEVPPGDYALNVGWFDPQSGARLGVRGGTAPERWAEAGIVHLGVITVP